ncbi:MAG: response regulator transcription factor [Planctomycetota bacterium]
MARLLVIEDEPALAAALARGLREESYVVETVGDGEAALWAARTQNFDAMLLDVRIPALNGYEVCRRLRAERSRLPILMLTACDSTEDVVRGLDAGADDYVTKPFAFAELLARLRALIRRGSAGTEAELRAGPLRLQTASMRAFRGDQEIVLTEMEFRVLELLMRRVGSVVPRERLFAAMWEDEIGPGSNALEVHVANLRKKLDDRRGEILQTRRGVGYVIVAPAEEGG